ncbi:hypothetical protein [Faecalibaculum rodentium]|uniref:hypothetical protein n=1 Tax=Faecalibaculum rodentium TaxID=1702221 RepID=UPI001F5635EB|nr:hypothetical protein [Faecalibaculum rodentium]
MKKPPHQMTAERCTKALEQSHDDNQSSVKHHRILDELKKRSQEQCVTNTIIPVFIHNTGPVIACQFGCWPKGENLIAGDGHGSYIECEKKPGKEGDEEDCDVWMFFTERQCFFHGLLLFCVLRAILFIG